MQNKVVVFSFILSFLLVSVNCTHEYVRGIQSLDFFKHRFTDTECRQYIDAIVDGVRFREVIPTGKQCVAAAYDIMDSFHYINHNVSRQNDISNDEHHYPVRRHQEMLFSFSLIVSKAVSDSYSDAVGNCTNAASDVWRNFSKEVAQF